VKPDGSVVAYDWDANGNMIARTEGNQTTEFEYDYDNRLVRIVYPNGSEVRFGYDGLGRRVFRQEGANVRYFYYDGDRIIAEREGSSWVVRYLLGLKPCGHVVSGQVRVYHADRLGSVRWVTDGSGNLVASYVYEGFGKIVGQGGNEVVPYRFCGLWGYRNDGDAGLLHVGARYYEVETGRWVQKDRWLGEIFKPQSLNSLIYCINNPINYIDSLGYVPKFVWKLLTSVVAAMGIGIIIGIVLDDISEYFNISFLDVEIVVIAFINSIFIPPPWSGAIRITCLTALATIGFIDLFIEPYLEDIDFIIPSPGISH
jgi:RHS repeat-associated protein